MREEKGCQAGEDRVDFIPKVEAESEAALLCFRQTHLEVG